MRRFPACFVALLALACGEPGGGIPDGGGAADASAAHADAGASSDAGQDVDGGSQVDAGLPPDGGAGPDAGLPSDAGPEPDAGVDGGAPADAGHPGADGGLPTPGTLTVRIGGPDDAVASYLMEGGGWNIFSGESVPLGRREYGTGDGVSYHTALRFPSVALPPGARIVDARLSWHPTNEVDSSVRLLLNVYAEKSADSPPLDPASYEAGRPDQRPRTTAFVDRWVVRCNDSCTDLTEYDCPQRQLDCWDRDLRYACPKPLTTLVQEVIDLPGWQSGNALTLLLVNAAGTQDTAYRASRTITTWNETKGPPFAPELIITWD